MICPFCGDEMKKCFLSGDGRSKVRLAGEGDKIGIFDKICGKGEIKETEYIWADFRIKCDYCRKCGKIIMNATPLK